MLLTNIAQIKQIVPSTNFKSRFVADVIFSVKCMESIDGKNDLILNMEFPPNFNFEKLIKAFKELFVNTDASPKAWVLHDYNSYQEKHPDYEMSDVYKNMLAVENNEGEMAFIHIAPNYGINFIEAMKNLKTDCGLRALYKLMFPYNFCFANQYLVLTPALQLDENAMQNEMWDDDFSSMFLHDFNGNDPYETNIRWFPTVEELNQFTELDNLGLDEYLNSNKSNTITNNCAATTYFLQNEAPTNSTANQLNLLGKQTDLFAQLLKNLSNETDTYFKTQLLNIINQLNNFVKQAD